MKHRRSIDPDSETGAFEFEGFLGTTGDTAADARHGLGADERQMPKLNALAGIDDDLAGESLPARGEASERPALTTGDQFTISHSQLCEFARVLLGLGAGQPPTRADRHDLDFVHTQEQRSRRSIFDEELSDLHATAVNHLTADLAAKGFEGNTFDELHTTVLKNQTTLTGAVSRQERIGSAVTAIEQTLDFATPHGRGRERVGRPGLGEFGSQGATGAATKNEPNAH